VYNSSSHKLITVTNGEMSKIGFNLVEEVPLNGIMWKPSVVATKYAAWYYVNVLLLHLFPALLIDGLLHLRGKKPL
jgi:fatty acyl-CoA reductase